MKRFLTAVAVSAILIAGAGVYAGDYAWSGGTSSAWLLGTNWGPAGYPGSGVPSRVIDRADIAISTNNPVVYSIGDGNFNSLMIQELRIDSRTAAAPVALTVSSDRMHVRHTELFTAADKTATLLVTGTGIFKTDDLVANATVGSFVLLDIDVPTRVSGQTTISANGECKCDADPAGVVMDLGYLVMEDGSTLTKLGAGICESS